MNQQTRPALLQALYEIAPAARSCDCWPTLCCRCRHAVLLLPLSLRRPVPEQVQSLRITGRIVAAADLALPMPTLSEIAEDPP